MGFTPGDGFYYSIACIYFSSGDINNSIKYLNKVINGGTDLRHDIQAFARILSLVAHFELGNDDLVRHQLKSVYRFLAHQKRLNNVRREVFSFLRKTPSMDQYNIHDHFVQLLHNLKQLEQNIFERRSFLYLDIVSWLESKIDGVPVEEIMQEKFNRIIKFSS